MIRALLPIAISIISIEPLHAQVRVSGDQDSQFCVAAGSMAQSAFDAAAPRLHWPPHEHRSDSVKIILRQKDRDPSGGNAFDLSYSALEFDRRFFSFATMATGSEFDRIVPSIENRKQGWTLVFGIHGFGWRGDQYEPVLVAGNVSPEGIEDAKSDPDRRLALSWIPQIILRDREANIALLELGWSPNFWSSWRVSEATPQGFLERCRIAFSDDDDRDGVAHLPRELRMLADSLDDALGPGLNEGTLQSTARIRAGVGYGWKNVAVRPWAEPVPGPYNSREEVDDGLATWGRVNQTRSAVQRRIARLYPSAEMALTEYYRSHFPDLDAGALAKQRLDQMYRAYFAFPKAR